MDDEEATAQLILHLHLFEKTSFTIEPYPDPLYDSANDSYQSKPLKLYYLAMDPGIGRIGDTSVDLNFTDNSLPLVRS